MHQQYAYTPLIWPSFLTFLILLILSIYGWHRRSVPGALPFMVGCLFGAAAAACSVMGYAALDMTTMVAWYKVQAILQLPIVTSLFCFILEFAWPGRWLTRRNLILLAIAPVVYLGLVMTNELHHLAWRSYQVQGTVHPELAPLGWLFVAYGFLLLGGLNLFVLGWLFWRFPQHRWPVGLMLVGQLGGHLGWTLGRAGVISSSLPITILAMDFEFLVYAVAFFGFRILDPIPMARNTAIEQLQAGMIVLDPGGKIVSLNPSARAILGSTKNHLLHRPIHEFLPLADTLAPSGPAEIQLGEGTAASNYQLEISSLKDWRGFEVGHLLMLRDVTGQKRAEAEILEQQRAIATLQERERLARELHDGIGQALGFATLKLGAARQLIADQKVGQADNQLEHLESVIIETHADVREHILDLRTAPDAHTTFFSALQRYLDGFRQNYEMHVEVCTGAGVEEDVLPLEAQVQLFRIIQEALSNARKHAGTKDVRLSFERQDGMVHVAIRDNGTGFDTLQPAAGTGHFGLRFMRERAEHLGGSLRVQSFPGHGTCVEVDLPVQEKAAVR